MLFPCFRLGIPREESPKKFILFHATIVFYLDCLILNCKHQRVQNTAARLICNINKFYHITPTLVKLHWLQLRYRINFKILLITFKVIHGLAPEYLSEILTRKNNCNYNYLRSSSEILSQQPRTKNPTHAWRSM